MNQEGASPGARPGANRRRGWARKAVTDWLMARIERGVLQPGQQVPPEPQLCALLGVGRSSVREAVQGLVAAGLLEVRPGTGTYVRAAGAESVLAPAELSRRLAPVGVLDVLELRKILEAGIAELATDRAATDELDAVERVLEAGLEAVHDPNAFADCAEQFHLGLAAAAHNAALVQMTAALNILLRHRRVSMATDPVSNERSLRDHWRILDAIRAKQLPEAQDAVLTIAQDAQRHVVQEARTIIRAARERHLADRSPRDNDAGVRVGWTT